MEFDIEVPRTEPAAEEAPAAALATYPCECKEGNRSTLAEAVVHGWKAHLRLVYGARKQPDGIYVGAEQILERSNPGAIPAVYLPVEKYRPLAAARRPKGKPGRKPKVKPPADVLDVARLTAVPDVGDPGNSQPSGSGVRRAGGREGSGRDAPLPASPAKKWPCRWPECDGGSDRSGVGRDRHERTMHGGLAGPSTKGGWQSRISNIAPPDKDADGRYPCSRRCGAIFDTEPEFLRHMAEGHAMPPSPAQAPAEGEAVGTAVKGGEPKGSGSRPSPNWAAS